MERGWETLILVSYYGSEDPRISGTRDTVIVIYGQFGRPNCATMA